MKILIVDDEHLARARLKDLLIEIDPDFVVLEAGDGMSALDLAGTESPDLVLMDIRMPVMDGLEAAGHLAGMQPAPAVVFTTAYQDHAIEAFELHAVDYLLKPIQRARLNEALQRSRIINRATLNAITEDTGGQAYRTHLSANSHGKIILIPVDEICYLKADQKYVAVGWAGRETLINESLKSLEQEYGDRFLRIHRNALIAPGAIRSLEKARDGSFMVYLKEFKEGLPVSRRHLHDVRQTLKTMS